MAKLSHLDESGRARMVDVTEKDDTLREAVAKGSVRMRPETLALIQSGGVPKGDVLAVAQVAGVMAAKRTHELIPMCHPLLLSAVDVRLEPDEKESAINITATGKLRPCLLTDQEIDLRAALRGGEGEEGIRRGILAALESKPDAHHLSDGNRPRRRKMTQIGG